MDYLILTLALLLFAAFICKVVYLKKSRKSDCYAIAELVKGRGARAMSVKRDDQYWRYWLRGWFGLSNCARIYVVVAEEPSGLFREIHVAFDQWISYTAEMQILLERDMPSSH